MRLFGVVGDGKSLSASAHENGIARKPIFHLAHYDHLLSALTAEDKTLLSMGVVLHSFWSFPLRWLWTPTMQYNFPQPIGRHNVKSVRPDPTLIVEP